jgi:hypothetical protein
MTSPHPQLFASASVRCSCCAALLTAAAPGQAFQVPGACCRNPATFGETYSARIACSFFFPWLPGACSFACCFFVLRQSPQIYSINPNARI